MLIRSSVTCNDDDDDDTDEIVLLPTDMSQELATDRMASTPVQDYPPAIDISDIISSIHGNLLLFNFLHWSLYMAVLLFIFFWFNNQSTKLRLGVINETKHNKGAEQENQNIKKTLKTCANKKDFKFFEKTSMEKICLICTAVRGCSKLESQRQRMCCLRVWYEYMTQWWTDIVPTWEQLCCMQWQLGQKLGKIRWCFSVQMGSDDPLARCDCDMTASWWIGNESHSSVEYWLQALKITGWKAHEHDVTVVQLTVYETDEKMSSACDGRDCLMDCNCRSALKHDDSRQDMGDMSRHRHVTVDVDWSLTDWTGCTVSRPTWTSLLGMWWWRWAGAHQKYSVLSAFSCSLLLLVLCNTPSIQSDVLSYTSFGCHHPYTWVSLAYQWQCRLCFWISGTRSAVHITNRNGRRTKPCSTVV